MTRAIAPRPQLLTYPNSLGGDLRTLGDLLEGPLDGVFHGVHVLPPFPSSGDRGFAPLTHDVIDPRFGGWDDIRRIAADHDVLLDLMINHISRQSLEFRDFERHGRDSAYADLFITIDKIWPDGEPSAADVARIFLRKPDAPFSNVTIEDTGRQERIWTSFGTADWSEQIDLDVTSSATRDLITRWLRQFAERGVRIVRLDAVGYVIKKPGTTCFMVEPEIYEFLAWVTDVAETFGLAILPEVHDSYATHERLSAHGFWTYDFVLPGLLLHAFETGETGRLAHHLRRSPSRQFTNLDCHDGIPVRPDLDGVLTPQEMADLADRVPRPGWQRQPHPVRRARRERVMSTSSIAPTTRRSVRTMTDTLPLARSSSSREGFHRSTTWGLLAGPNDHEAVVRTGEGRAINRHDYTMSEIKHALDRPIVRRVMDLVRLRNIHPAFDGTLEVEADDDHSVRLRWRHGADVATLDVDFAGGGAVLTDGDRSESLAGWAPSLRSNPV